MPKYIERFSFVCDETERLAIRALAERLQRTQSDAVRLVVREAAQKVAEPAPQSEKAAAHVTA